jgi:hypothetical protein
VSRPIGLLSLRILPTVILVCTLTLAALAGCEKPRSIAVQVSIPGLDSIDAPAAGVGVVALPYDRDSVLGALERRATTPRPGTAALDTLFTRFRRPFTAYTALSYRVAALRDSIDLLPKLDSLPRSSPEYGRISERVSRLTDSLRMVEPRTEWARVELDRARRNFVSRSESLRTAIRHWEDSTYRGYDSIVDSLSKARGREPSTDTTNTSGWAQFTLPPGQWWLYARAWDTSDPNAEWYWNLPLSGDTIRLSSRTGHRRPRY